MVMMAVATLAVILRRRLRGHQPVQEVSGDRHR